MPIIQGPQQTNGLRDAIINLNPESQINRRVAPTGNNHAEQSTIWIQTKDLNGNNVNAAFINAGKVNGQDQWLELANAAGPAFAAITVNPGDITVTAGNIDVLAGMITSFGDITSTDGTVRSEDGSGDFSELDNFTITALNNSNNTVSSILQLQKSRSGGIVQAGDNIGVISFDADDGVGLHEAAFIASVVQGTPGAGQVAGDLEFYTSPDAVAVAVQRMVIADTGEVTINAPDSGVGLTIVAGGETITAGDLVVTAGNITATAGDITATAGDLIATAGNVTVTAGDINALAGQIRGLTVVGSTIYAEGDEGGVPATTAFTNGVDLTQGAGVMTVLSTTGNPGTNAGYIKIYVGATPCFIPFWSNIAP